MNNESEKKSHPSSMVRTDDFWIHLGGYLGSSLYEKFNNIIHKPVKTIATQDVPYRVLSHWDSQGLLECERNKEKGWRKFSLVGSLWLFTILELRKYGFGIEVLKEVKKSLFDENGRLNALVVFYLNFAIYVARPTYLIVFDNGHTECFDYNQYKTAVSLSLFDAHLVINLNSLLGKLKIPNLPSVDFPIEKAFSDEEQMIFEMIKNTEFDTATVCKTDEGRIDRMEFKTKCGHRKRVVELLQEGENLDILIKKRKGEVIYAATTRIEKV